MNDTKIQRRAGLLAASTYLPEDRLAAVMAGRTLPDRTNGSALFADISGFTPLTEAASKALGPSRGAEEVTRQLEEVYAGLIREVHRQGGSVISFAGDAITCWFEGDNGWRGASAGAGIQRRMKKHSRLEIKGVGVFELAVKVAVATGPARRFLIGDPTIQLIDTVAGRTIARMIEGEHLANRGDLLLDEATVAALGEHLTIAEWRQEEGQADRFALVKTLVEALEIKRGVLDSQSLDPNALEQWLLPEVFARLRAGRGEFLTELRPAVAMFVRFDGIDYDGDPDAGKKLDAFIRWSAGVIKKYGGALVQLTIGDKGSFFYVAFGAPVANENDNRRALSAALELRTPPLELQFIHIAGIGLSRGTMRTGSYGGSTRRTYGILGDEVNLAARLMQKAGPERILVSGWLQLTQADAFAWESLGGITVKGKSEPIPVFELKGFQEGTTFTRRESRKASPMVGRDRELGVVREKIQLTLSGVGQVLGITADPGMGKTRLVAEAVRLAREAGLQAHDGECQSHGQKTPYLVWWNCWRQLLEAGPGTPEEQAERVARNVQEWLPEVADRVPLLGVVVNLPIPETDFSRSLEGQVRKRSLEALIIDLLRVLAARSPRVLVIEDGHWMDPLSLDLLEVVIRVTRELPVLVLLAYRPGDDAAFPGPAIRQRSRFTEIVLGELDRDSVARFIELKMGGGVKVPREIVDRLLQQSGGNPFYIEEILQFLRETGRALDERASGGGELPHTLQSLILSRIDRLTESEQATLKVASVIGRHFEAALLWGAYPDLGRDELIRSDLERLTRQDITSREPLEPALAYVFKHVLTQQVTYESLPFAFRERLHRMIGEFLERGAGDNVTSVLNLLAHHFGHSDSTDKKRNYLLKAAQAAQAAYANAAAIDYFRQALPLLDKPAQVPFLRQLGTVMELVGDWPEAGKQYEQALAAANELHLTIEAAHCEAALGELLRKQGRYDDSLAKLQAARKLFDRLNNYAGVAQTLHTAGTVAAQQGRYDEARKCYDESLALCRQSSERKREASLLSNLGIICMFEKDNAAARPLYEESLRIRRELNDLWAVAISLNNLGLLLSNTGDHAGARAILEECVTLNRRVGDRWALANSLTSLAEVALSANEAALARPALDESLALNRDLGDRRAVAYLQESFAQLAFLENDFARSIALVAEADALRQEIGTPRSPSEQARLDTWYVPLARSPIAEPDGEPGNNPPA